MHLQSITLNKVKDYIFFLSILIAAISFTSIFPHISPYVNFLFVLILIFSIFLHLKNVFLPEWVLNIISIILIVFPFLGLSSNDILMPSIESLTLILSVRFLGKKTSREYFQIYLLSMLLLGGSSLFDISWMFLIRLILMLILTIFAMLLLTYVKEVGNDFIGLERLLNLMNFAIFIAIVSIPLSAFFFIILPRTPVPLVDIGLSKAKTGFSSTVNLGSIREIEEDNNIVMRVKMKQIPEKELYWRVITFDTFDGRVWQKKLFEMSKSSIYGEKISYTIILEPLTEKYLPTLDYPVSVSTKNLIYEYPGTYKIAFSLEKTMKYDAVSFINYKLTESNPSSIYLKIPPNITEKIKTLTNNITSQASNKKEIAESIIRFLSNYQYSLKDLPVGENSIEEFLFNKKKGNCEYFATAMVLMLRIKDIPARVVGGFRGGTYNSFGGYYIIRASDAHLWVEAWIDGQWLRFDPSGKISRKTENIVFYFIDYIWNSIVLDYDIRSQLRLVKSIKIPKFEFNIKLFLIPFLVLVLYGSFKFYRYMKKTREPLNRFFSIMKKYGFERRGYQGLEEFVSMISDKNLREKAENFVKLYEEIYFKDKKINKEDYKKLKVLLDILNESRKS
ncbi:MAG: DUF3488 and transglutaminase-like domain-containing protein [Thermodesulfovibrio sp.]|nr:DUF3488 and transglutaminase-like domain-containing protein [Thermodesulfovibrio sp.]MDW7972144.1 DUF3488 and transglutaminase-like domain-containing protein [Thermodesulfovibrio sp.]